MAYPEVHIYVLDESDSITWPDDESAARVECWGAGGGGDRGGGGSGAYSRSEIGKGEATSMSVVVGSGGAAGADGGDTYVVNDGDTVCSAAGGKGADGLDGGDGGDVGDCVTNLYAGPWGSVCPYATNGASGGTVGGADTGGGGGGGSAPPYGQVAEIIPPYSCSDGYSAHPGQAPTGSSGGSGGTPGYGCGGNGQGGDGGDVGEDGTAGDVWGAGGGGKGEGGSSAGAGADGHAAVFIPPPVVGTRFSSGCCCVEICPIGEIPFPVSLNAASTYNAKTLDAGTYETEEDCGTTGPLDIQTNDCECGDGCDDADDEVWDTVELDLGTTGRTRDNRFVGWLNSIGPLNYKLTSLSVTGGGECCTAVYEHKDELFDEEAGFTNGVCTGWQYKQIASVPPEVDEWSWQFSIASGCSEAECEGCCDDSNMDYGETRSNASIAYAYGKITITLCLVDEETNEWDWTLAYYRRVVVPTINTLVAGSQIGDMTGAGCSGCLPATLSHPCWVKVDNESFSDTFTGVFPGDLITELLEQDFEEEDTTTIAMPEPGYWGSALYDATGQTGAYPYSGIQFCSYSGYAIYQESAKQRIMGYGDGLALTVSR